MFGKKPQPAPEMKTAALTEIADAHVAKPKAALPQEPQYETFQDEQMPAPDAALLPMQDESTEEIDRQIKELQQLKERKATPPAQPTPQPLQPQARPVEDVEEETVAEQIGMDQATMQVLQNINARLQKIEAAIFRGLY